MKVSKDTFSNHKLISMMCSLSCWKILITFFFNCCESIMSSHGTTVQHLSCKCVLIHLFDLCGVIYNLCVYWPCFCANTHLNHSHRNMCYDSPSWGQCPPSPDINFWNLSYIFFINLSFVIHATQLMDVWSKKSNCLISKWQFSCLNSIIIFFAV